MTVAYDAQANAFSHRVQWVVEIDLDRCDNNYNDAGAPSTCTAGPAADGLRCFYTFPTCQDPANFRTNTAGFRTYRFCLSDVPWSDTTDLAYPYLKQLVPVPQRIDPKKLFTFPERVKCRMTLDWAPLPLDLDKVPAATAANSSTAGEFWRNLLAKNRNYPGRALRIKRGFSVDAGFALADFAQVGPEYKLTQINIDGDVCVVEAESPLADLDKRKIPSTLSKDNKLSGAIDNSQVTITIDNANEIPDPALFSRNTLFIELRPPSLNKPTEIMAVTGRNTSTHVLDVVRQQFGTDPNAYADDSRVALVAGFGTDAGGAKNVTEVMQDILEYAGVASAKVTSAGFSRVKAVAWPRDDIVRVVRKPKSAAKLIQELREMRGIMLFLDTDGKFNVELMAPNQNAAVLTDEHMDNVSVIEDDDTRITRCLYYYGPVEDNPRDAEDFDNAVIVINTDLEVSTSFGDVRELIVMDQWLNPAETNVGAVRNIARRLISFRAYGSRLIKFDLDVKEAALTVGESRTLKTRHITDTLGTTEARSCIIVAKRETKRALVTYEAVDTNYSGPFFRIGPDTMAATWDTASDEDKAFGYWGDADNRVGVKFEFGKVFW